MNDNADAEVVAVMLLLCSSLFSAPQLRPADDVCSACVISVGAISVGAEGVAWEFQGPLAVRKVYRCVHVNIEFRGRLCAHKRIFVYFDLFVYR